MQQLETFIALNRFGLGPAPGEAAIAAPDPRGWIADQITPAPRLPATLRGFRSSAAIFAEVYAARRIGPSDETTAMAKDRRKTLAREIMARAQAMIDTPTPFAERMVLFWSNHFTVSGTKGIIRNSIPGYEREVVRPHIFGRFADMLRAASRHPVMLTYLDNHVSLGENSRVGKRRLNRTGGTKTLNENLAREILELHTLGVNGGYDQADVIELSKALTGWSHDGVGSKKASYTIQGRFKFRPAFHEPGPKTVLGKTYGEAGADEGARILDDLARHPSTARFIATKLVRHFVADTPPAEAVDSIARVFLDTDGDLAQVSRALIALPQVWANPLPKVKTHYELVISTHRLTGNRDAKPRDLLQPLREFGQIPFAAPSPAGWGDSAADWLAPEALMRRIEWIRRYASTLPTTLDPTLVLEDALGPVASSETRTWVARAPSGDEAIAMILASPEFQRR
ncbi:DUF1800 domain-containing protein [Alisedimentitalea sp. MJ-SS2]|uniref:DUF1800 domain-containing protein n=1 Tax=Aliisedimentitalea sp. MJ-SS2 TaxID=3049795 RepID=UPI00290AF0DB|nr:DUF1800 domain-containing protein [Alisedimentitalea sp. MJ-SS2]MDU8927434.1 DUF1800 domain-containing protein [Alisedimentitalea sp. MJ-SS2]